MIISLAGDPGSGKTSVAKLLAKELGWPWYSMGDLRGKLALEKGMTIDELNKLGETEAWTDRQTDEYQRELGKKEDNFVIEGRLSWHFIPQSFKVYLTCDEQEAARRIFLARKSREPGREDEALYRSIAEAREEIAKRVASDTRRYEKHYGVKYRDLDHFDLVVDTTRHKGSEETMKVIMDAYAHQSRTA